MSTIAMLLDNAFRPDPRVASEARTLAEAGHRVTVLAWDREGERPPCEDWHGVRVRRLGPRSRHGLGSRQVLYLLVFWWHAYWWLAGREVDAVHCHDLNTLPVGWLVAAAKRCRLVYDAHESYADMLGANVAGWIKRAAARIERALIGRADAVLTVGELLAQDLERRGARRSWVVGNWKRLSDFDVPPDEAAARRHELGLNGSTGEPPRLLVGYIGWLNADRGIAPLLAAVRASEGVSLLVGGDGPSSAAVRQAEQACPRIRYLGFVDPEQIPLYTSLCDVIYYGLDTSNVNARYSA
ncbi:MAG: glycosyltransferase, partial [bacterium]